jgi:hypothetical protein
VSTGLIVLAVVAFLLVDGVILFLVFRSRRSADDYATIPVPGETTVSLPTGKLKLNYQESYKASSGIGWSRALIGTVEITQPGAYTVTARGDLPNAVEPQILIGK